MPEIISRSAAKAAGLTRYFTGEPCKHGHIAERYVSSKSCVECHREWYLADPVKTRESVRQWKAAHPEYERERLATDPVFKLTYNLRRRIALSLKRGSKSASTLALLGCDPKWFLAEVAPGLLAEGSAKHGVEMTLGNYGKVWQWDHLEPLAGFDLSDPAWQRCAFHYGNLRPMPAKINMSKGAKAPNPIDVWVALPKPG